MTSLISTRQLAVAAMLGLGAAAVPAQAQVSLYGLVDLGIGSYREAGLNQTRQTRVESGKLTTSYWGMSGGEDLGNGLRAQFKLESFFRADGGEQGRFNGDPQFARTASVGLSHADWGSVNLGRNTTALFASTLSFNALGDSFGFSPSIRHHFGAGQNAVSGDTGWSDSIAYASPVLGSGWRLGAAMAARESSNGGNWSLSVGYANGPLAASLVLQDVEKDGSSPVADTRTRQVGAAYDFGPAKLFGLYSTVENRSDGSERRLTGVGARVPLGQGALVAQWGRNDADQGADRDTLSVGYLYPMSRRTELYGVLMQDRLEGRPAGSAFAAGMRHRF
jgi:predicted porin